jgi:hypothetical protein
MITQKKTYNFPGTVSATEVTYTWTSNNSCASVTPSVGVVSPGESVEFTFQFEDELCFNTVFTLSSEDNVCSGMIKQNFSFANPCTNLAGTLSNVPSATNPFIYNVQTTGGSGVYQYTWQFDTSIFQEVTSIRDNPSNQLILEVKDSVVLFPNSAEITVTITDTINGCQEVVSNTQNFCQPIATDITVNTHCISTTDVGTITAQSSTGGVILNTTECAGTTIDWTTLELEYDTTKLYVENNSNVLTIYGIGVSTQTSYNITYRVKNNIGTTSSDGTIQVILPVCSIVTNFGPVFTTLQATKFLTGESSGTIKTLELEPIIFSQ